MSNRIIYFHVGLGKTGSTYLQVKFFPKLKGLQYVPTIDYKRYQKVIEKSKANKILVSREFDRQLEDEIKKFAALYPEARIIIVLREHDTWIASQYKRFVKNGFNGSFRKFIDIDCDWCTHIMPT